MDSELDKNSYDASNTDTDTDTLLSIIIPTRNRCEYAVDTIRSLLKIKESCFEIVVQDNSDNNHLEDYIKNNFNDKRIVYNHVIEQLDVIANFDQSLAFVSGDYLTFIGDDDGVNSELLTAARWCKSHKIDALTPENIAGYFWPDLRQKYYGASNSGKLTIKPFTGKFTKKNPTLGLHKSAAYGFQNLVNTTIIPKLYYGLVKRACFDRVKARTGSYFPGCSPDMSSAIAVSSYVENFYTVDYPLYLPGSSAKSTAGSSAEKKHKGSLREQTHIPKKVIDEWPLDVPKFFAVQTVWAQSGLSALRATGRNDILMSYNSALLHAMTGVFNPDYFNFVVKSFTVSLKKDNKNILFGYLKLSYGILYTYYLRAKSFTKRIFSKFFVSRVSETNGLSSIYEAVDQLENFLEQSDCHFDSSFNPGSIDKKI